MNELPDYPPSALINAWQEGYDAGKQNKRFQANPYPKGSISELEWILGWKEGSRK